MNNSVTKFPVYELSLDDDDAPETAINISDAFADFQEKNEGFRNKTKYNYNSGRSVEDRMMLMEYQNENLKSLLRTQIIASGQLRLQLISLQTAQEKLTHDNDELRFLNSCISS